MAHLTRPQCGDYPNRGRVGLARDPVNGAHHPAFGGFDLVEQDQNLTVGSVRSNPLQESRHGVRPQLGVLVRNKPWRRLHDDGFLAGGVSGQPAQQA